MSSKDDDVKQPGLFTQCAHLYSTAKGPGSLAMLDLFSVHQRDLKWTFNYYC